MQDGTGELPDNVPGFSSADAQTPQRQPKEASAGTVTVRVLSADDLIAADDSGVSDPYVKLAEGSGRKAKTTVQHQTLR